MATNLLHIVVKELLELIGTITLLLGIFQCRIKKSVIPVILVFLLFIVSIILLFFTIEERNYPPFFVVIELLVILICIEVKPMKRILLYFIAYLCNYICNTVISILYSVVSNKDFKMVRSNTSSRITVMLISIGILLLISAFIHKWRNGIIARKVEHLSAGYFLVFFPGLLSCVFILVFVQTSNVTAINQLWDRIAVISVTGVCLFFIFGTIALIFINESRKHYQVENRLKQQYLEIQDSYYKKIFENDQELRRFRHDIKAHMGCMRVLADMEKFYELSNYISEVTNEMDYLLNHVVNSGNDIVDALLNYLVDEAVKERIKIRIEGGLPNELRISSTDLCSILSNTISNAIEACKKLEDGREIDIHMSIVGSNLFLQIVNPVTSIVNVEMIRGKTTKADKRNHGYGVQNVIDTVNKYNGDVKFLSSGNRFTVEIIVLDII